MSEKCDQCGIVPEKITVGEMTLVSCGLIREHEVIDVSLSPCPMVRSHGWGLGVGLSEEDKDRLLSQMDESVNPKNAKGGE